MKNTTKIARLLLAGTTAVLLSYIPASAETYAQSGFADMYKNINAGLVALQEPTTELHLLTADQLGQLAVILDGTDTDAVKKTAIETVFRDSLHPTVATMNSVEAKQLDAQLKAQLANVGLAYPTDKALTFAQVQQLLDIFAVPDASDATDAAAVLSDINNHVEETVTNDGAVQLKAQLYANLDKVGIVVPATTVLTFDQVIALTDVFNRKTNDANKKTAAMTILGMI